MSHRSKRATASTKPFGLMRTATGKYKCGLCGQKKRMSRAHVPPQCAGNTGLVTRSHLLVRGNEVAAGRADVGGLHFRGLCRECNTEVGSYDKAYGDFANAMRPLWVKDWQLELPEVVAVPDIIIRPGDVARSVIGGVAAASPMLRERWPILTEALRSGGAAVLPDALSLRLALARGVSARVSGAFAGFHVIGPRRRFTATGRPIGISSLGSTYFPPLAWELVHSGPTLLDEYKWADASNWIQYDIGEVVPLRALVTALPPTAHPWHHPALSEHWSEVAATKYAPIVECANVEGGHGIGIGSPLTVRVRAHLTMDEIAGLRHRSGLPPMPSS